MHVRKQIRDTVLERLKPALQSRLSFPKSRFTKHKTLPSLYVYSDDENVESDDELVDPQFRDYSRFMDLVIEYAGKADDDFEDEADACLVTVEEVLATDDTLGGLTTEIAMVGVNNSYDPREAEPMATQAAIYRVWYRTHAQDPQTPIA